MQCNDSSVLRQYELRRLELILGNESYSVSTFLLFQLLRWRVYTLPKILFSNDVHRCISYLLHMLESRDFVDVVDRA